MQLKLLSRAARTLLNWSQTDLAEKARIGLASVKRAEAGAMTTPVIEAAILRTFGEAGIRFLERGELWNGARAQAGVVLLEDAGDRALRDLSRKELQ